MTPNVTLNGYFAALAALVLSISMHLVGGLQLSAPKPPVQLEGGAPTSISRLGNSFRDVSVGSAQPAPAEQTQAMTPELTPTSRPEVTPRSVVATPSPTPQAAAPAPVPSRIDLPALTPDNAQRALPVASVTPKSAAVEPTKPVLDPPVTPVTPTTQISALPEPVPLKPQPQKRATPPKPPAAPGAAQAERTGSETGKTTATAAKTSKQAAQKTTASGNAAITSYAGKVWRKIQRARPSSAVKGTTLIAISISDRGRLTSVTIARSSGSPQLDQLALRAARKAAPFPVPPDRKPHRFTFRVSGL